MSRGVLDMSASKANTPAELSVRVCRLIRVPRERVFEAWIKPDLRRKWWATDSGEQMTFCEIDARVGGCYCQKQIGSCESSDAPDDYEWIMQGEFTEFVPPERLVFTWNVNHPDEPESHEVVTVEFLEVDGGTEVVIAHNGILSTRLRDGTDKGWTTLMEKLAAVLEG